MRLVDCATVGAALVDSLGLDGSLHAPSSEEVLACAIRRVAAMSCPCSRRSIVRAVAGSLETVVATEDLHERVDAMVDTLIAHGDLAELRESEDEFERSAWLVHTAPPSFVRRKSGAVILLGVAPDEIFPLPGQLGRRIVHRGHVRLLEEDEAGNLPGYLADFGLLDVPPASWQRSPPASTAEELLRAVNGLLDIAPRAGDIPELRILDWSTPVGFYNARWVEPKRHSGRFVARRPQAYGPPLWCFIELDSGRPGRLLDLPRNEILSRGCDEAWRLQAAIDSARGQPQQFRRREEDAAAILDFFAPIPRWADRRFTVIGEVAPPRGCLFSRRLRASEIDEELEYIRDELWLEVLKED
jgi:hypothetical protein